jgi:hypothetical protein
MTSLRHQGGYCTPKKETQSDKTVCGDLFVEYEIERFVILSSLALRLAPLSNLITIPK